MTRRRFCLCTFGMVLWVFPAFSADADAERKQIALWVRDLDNKAFAVREAATSKLIAKGKPAVSAVAAAAIGNSLEATQRVFRILRELSDSPDPETVNLVKVALVKLANSNSKLASAAAKLTSKNYFQE